VGFYSPGSEVQHHVASSNFCGYWLLAMLVEFHPLPFATCIVAGVHVTCNVVLEKGANTALLPFFSVLELCTCKGCHLCYSAIVAQPVLLITALVIVCMQLALREAKQYIADKPGLTMDKLMRKFNNTRKLGQRVS
jgi:hypothetical protein